MIVFLPHDSKTDLLQFNATTKNDEHNLSHNAVDFLSFDNLFVDVISLKA